MKLYSFQFKPLSKITEIPNSQSIFGMICYAYLEKYGEKDLESMLERFYNGNPDFLNSSFFFHDLLPTPQDITPDHQHELSKEQLIVLKQIKKIKYLSKEIFKDYLNNYQEFVNNYNENIFNNNYVIINNQYVVKNNEQTIFNNYEIKEDMQIRNHINEKQLFYNNIIYCSEQVIFDLYVKTNEEKIVDLIKDLKYVSIGSGKSIGYNLYSVVSHSIEEFNNNRDNKILLSLSTITEGINYDKSYYKLQTLNNKFNNVKTTQYKNCITVLLEGSSINTDKEYIGSVLKNSIENNTIYSNYLGLLI